MHTQILGQVSLQHERQIWHILLTKLYFAYWSLQSYCSVFFGNSLQMILRLSFLQYALYHILVYTMLPPVFLRLSFWQYMLYCVLVYTMLPPVLP